MARQTTAAEKAKICTMKALGASNKEIQEALPGRQNISRRQITRIYAKYGEKENYEAVGKSTGRPKKLDNRDARVALRALQTQQVDNASDLQRNFFQDVSVQTVKRMLKENGLSAHKRFAKLEILSKDAQNERGTFFLMS
ncbi:hypothetical protein D9611_009588 [Ephemerocybe angulata]|nr:hypothetical protein D9611_009588 [Tulosesus angulatus]